MFLLFKSFICSPNLYCMYQYKSSKLPNFMDTAEKVRQGMEMQLSVKPWVQSPLQKEKLQGSNVNRAETGSPVPQGHLWLQSSAILGSLVLMKYSHSELFSLSVPNHHPPHEVRFKKGNGRIWTLHSKVPWGREGGPTCNHSGPLHLQAAGSQSDFMHASLQKLCKLWMSVLLLRLREVPCGEKGQHKRCLLSSDSGSVLQGLWWRIA